jgi:hypothetical protein
VSDPGVARPDLCSIHAAAGQSELAGAVRGGLSADGHPLAGDDPPAPLGSGIDRAIRLSTAAAVLAVAGIAACVSYGHAYAVVRAHGETGITARLEPATIDGLVWASCRRRGGGRVPAQRAGRQPALGTPARPDVRTHLPPLGASQNGRRTKASPLPDSPSTPVTA